MVNKMRTKELVMDAIRQLRIERGFTPREIMQYIETNHDVKALDLRRGVFAALKRGADYGLFKPQRGGRYALRMAPTSPQLAVKRKATSEEDVNERGCVKKRRKSRRRCCTKMWVPKRRRNACKKRQRRRRKSSCKRRRKRTRKNRCAKRRRRSRKNRCAKPRRRSRKRACKRRRSRRRAKCRC